MNLTGFDRSIDRSKTEMNPSERALLREQMTEEELAPWRPFTWEDLKQKMDARIAELTEEEKADTKRCPVGATNEDETLATNEMMSGSPFSDENHSKFVLRKYGYIIEDKQVIPPNPLPETYVFSEETMSRTVLRRLGYRFTDEIDCLKKNPKKKSTKSKRNEILPEETGTTAIASGLKNKLQISPRIRIRPSEVTFVKIKTRSEEEEMAAHKAMIEELNRRRKALQKSKQSTDPTLLSIKQKLDGMLITREKASVITALAEGTKAIQTGED